MENVAGRSQDPAQLALVGRAMETLGRLDAFVVLLRSKPREVRKATLERMAGDVYYSIFQLNEVQEALRPSA